MKKYLIGSFVGGILVFAWQGLSWMALGIHDSSMKYHPSQKEIMNVLNSTTSEEAMYMMPSAPTKKEQQDMVESMKGKPWATIIYHKSFNTDMVRPFIRGFLVDVFLVVAFIYIVTRGATPIPRRIFAASVALGLSYFLWGPYMGHVWFQLPWSMITGDLIDSLVAWSICGIWLAWWLNRPGNGTAPVSQ